jgi:hypothetical protein
MARQQGMKITLSALPNGLTVDKNGNKLLSADFIFQCPPMNQFPVTRAFTTNNYDTIENVQYSSLISNQLKQFPFDTLVMELGVENNSQLQYEADAGARDAENPSLKELRKLERYKVSVTSRDHTPAWVPYPQFNGSNVRNPQSPAWFVDQLDDLVNAGAPFKFVAAYPGVAQSGLSQSQAQVAPVLSCSAQLLSFQEVHTAGEGDAIYLTTVTFAEWKDPNQESQGLGSQGTSVKLPTNVVIDANGKANYGNGQQSFDNVSLVDLSMFFYHDSSDWQQIAKENGITGIGQNDPLGNAPKYKKLTGTRTMKIKIPDVSRSDSGGVTSVYGSGMGVASGGASA